MRRFALPAGITVVVAVLLAVLAYGLSNAGASSTLDQAIADHRYAVAPDSHTALPVLNSTKSLSLAGFRGHVVMVNLYAAWCDACQQEAPLIRRAEAMLRAHGGTVLGVSYKDNVDDLLSFDQQYGVDYPVVTDSNGNFAQAYGVTGPPETFIINRQGRVQALRRLQLTNQWIDQTLPKILDGSA